MIGSPLDLWIDAGPVFLFTRPEFFKFLSRLILPFLTVSAAFAAVLISFVLIGGIVTFGGGGAVRSFRRPENERT